MPTAKLPLNSACADTDAIWADLNRQDDLFAAHRRSTLDDVRPGWQPNTADDAAVTEFARALDTMTDPEVCATWRIFRSGLVLDGLRDLFGGAAR